MYLQQIKRLLHQLPLHFDRSFSKSYKKQLKYLAILMVVVIAILWAMGHSRMLYHPEKSDRTLFYDVLFLLFDPGSISDAMSNGYVTIVALAGIVVFCGLFISVITNMLSRRVELYESGELHYYLQDHVVIIGYDRTVVPLIHFICQNEQLSGSKILLQASEDVAELRNILNNELSREEEKRLVVYSGNPTLAEDLSKLQLNQCKQIYIVGPDTDEGHDAICMDCLEKVATLMPEPGDEACPCYVQFASLESYDLLQHAELKPEIRQKLRFFPYNFEQVWGHRVMIDNCDGSLDKTVYLPIDSELGIKADSEKHVHIVIVGMNAMGIAIAESAAHIAHFPNFNQDDMRTRTIITLIDTDIREKMLHMKARLSPLFDLSYSRYLDGSVNPEIVAWSDGLGSKELEYFGSNFIDIAWEFVEGNASDPFVRNYLEMLAEDKDALVSLIFADADSESVISAATQLSHRIYESDSILQILVRQDENSSYVRMLSAADNSKYAKLKAFGQLDGFFSRRMIPEDFGRLVNACYNGTDPGDEEKVRKNWKDTNTDGQWSSMRSANMRFVRMRTLGYDITSSDYGNLQQLMKEHKEELMYVEHNRWNVEKLLTGFRPLTRKESEELDSLKDNEAEWKASKKMKKSPPCFAHLDICSWERLNKVDPGSVKYDKMVLLQLPEMLKAEANC